MRLNLKQMARVERLEETLDIAALAWMVVELEVQLEDTKTLLSRYQFPDTSDQ